MTHVTPFLPEAPMIPELDPLMDFRCPHCRTSLRFRRVRPSPDADPKALITPYRCPVCEAALREQRHPALANNWLWSRFYLPGVLLCALGIFVPSLGWLLPMAVAALGLGLAALVVYMVRERWGWKRYLPYPEKTGGHDE